MNFLKFSVLLTSIFTCAILFTISATAQVMVTPTNPQGWSKADTRAGGDVSFVQDSSSPAPSGALKLTADSTNAAKAQYMHGADDVPLSSVNELSYYSKRISTGSTNAAPSYQLEINLCGTDASFTTMVYEPYWQTGTVIGLNTWQQWDVDSGKFWSSRSVSCNGHSVSAGSGGPPFYTLTELNENFPGAVVIGFGVNIGTYNPDWIVETDLVSFNGTSYNFELYSTPTSMNDCKNGGWMTFNPPSGPFKNQGQCVSSTVPQ
jgi:hypothetical protein